ncbi:MAG: AMP-binding protein [Oceanicaulis sp.]
MTVLSRIFATARRSPDRPALRFLNNGEEETVTLTYGALAAEVTHICLKLCALGHVGGSAALIARPGPAFLTTLLGLMAAGTVVAPLPQPRGGPARHRVASSLKQLRPSIIVCEEEDAGELERLGPGVRRVYVSELRGGDGAGRLKGALPQAEAGDDAPSIIQFSSGSTAEPRGVVISGRNILANAAMIHSVANFGAEDVTVSWLPHTHDMGLIGGLLAPMLYGGGVVQMSPDAFFRRPVRWLQALTRYQARLTVSPDFGYALAARRISPKALSSLDLSQLKAAFIGAEPIRPATIDRFTQTFEPAGFNRSAFVTCYGLAETTLICTAGTAEIVGKHVSSGRAIEGVRIELRQASAEHRPGEGEIWIGGPHVALGLWDGRRQTYRPFEREDCESGGQRLVATGDLGRVDQGALIVLDRLKDTLPVRGGTLGPVELELEACGVHASIQSAAAVSISTGHGGDVALALEIDARGLDSEAVAAIEREVKARIAQEFGVRAALYRFKPWSLPRTTSGKIRRFEVRALLVEREQERESDVQAR